MVKDLLILRHGHAKSKSTYGDFGRELKDKGKRNAQRMGVWLAENELQPDCVIASPAVRAKRTAEKCCKTAGLNARTIAFDDRVFDALPQTVLGIIQSCPPETERLLIVGHNPSLSSLASMLSGEPCGLEPGSMAHLQITGEWVDLSPEASKKVQLVSPDDLPELFPYPDLAGEERRVRPAYYYTQSCVVPYRLKNDEVEVLIISSSKNKHWVVPKGIHDPGLSAQESAANEALEEAGVEGVVHDTVLGQYAYAKWEATCEVTVYPMEVTRELEPEEWEENHRLRRWVLADSAAQLINNADLGEIVAGLADYVSKKS
ncbi:histidine phosphatase family protein [Terasakiella pusilla]|uniref:histidine phosphatase family protein n=1 Tax=Terasakiella pusilla TaxID=64973 RepID=UPI003AA8AF88